MIRFIAISIICLSSLTLSLKAEPWIDTRNSWLRADIESLAAKGYIKSPVTTWPLMWSPIIEDLNELDDALLDEVSQQQVSRVLYKARFAKQKSRPVKLVFKAANQATLLRTYGGDQREKAELSTKRYGIRGDFAWNIEATRAYDPLDGEKLRFDNSYLAMKFGNWVVSAGAQERWWGPGWNSSLILGNNARPVPAVSIQRSSSEPFESPWLSWVGSWTVNSFMGQLESDRHVPHAKLWGMSVNFRPLESLEIGLRRTAQWGGDGRREDLDIFWDLLIGLDNCDEGHLSCDDRSNEPGNQLAAVDLKWHIPDNSYVNSLYFQMVGEDEAGYLPSRKVYQYGLEGEFQWAELQGNWFIEYADTTNDIGPNVTYNNGIYQTGYRYENRSLGSQYDNDTSTLTVGMISYFDNGDRLKASISKVDMNKDDDAGNHSLNSERIQFTQLSVKYELPTKSGLFSIYTTIKDKVIDSFSLQKSKYTLGVSWTMEL